MKRTSESSDEKIWQIRQTLVNHCHLFGPSSWIVGWANQPSEFPTAASLGLSWSHCCPLPNAKCQSTMLLLSLLMLLPLKLLLPLMLLLLLLQRAHRANCYAWQVRLTVEFDKFIHKPGQSNILELIAMQRMEKPKANWAEIWTGWLRKNQTNRKKRSRRKKQENYANFCKGLTWTRVANEVIVWIKYIKRWLWRSGKTHRFELFECNQKSLQWVMVSI